MANIETVEEHCKHKDCSYRKHSPVIGDYCDYIGAHQESRRCRISKCDKYTTEKVYFPKDDWTKRLF